MRHSFWIICAVVWLTASAPVGWAQDEEVLRSGRQIPLQFTVQPTFQQYTDGGMSIRQWSTRLHALVPIPLGQSMYARISTSYASADASTEAAATGANAAVYDGVSGLNDVSLSVTSQHEWGASSVVFDLSASAPVGKKGLTPQELQTTILLSQNYYTFSVPSFGQGLNVAPSITWAYPLSNRVVIGLGTALRYRGGYRPVERMENIYRPGREILVSGGVDMRLRATSALSLDVTQTFFGMDTLGGEPWFQAGNETAATAQYLWTRDFTSIRVRARYVGNARSTVPALPASPSSESPPPSSPPPEPSEQTGYGLRTVPQETALSVRCQARVRRGLHVAAQMEGGQYGETAYYEQRSIVTTRLSATWGIGRQVALRPHVGYTAGSFTGLDVGVGVRYEH